MKSKIILFATFATLMQIFSYEISAQDTVRYGDTCYMFNPLQDGTGWGGGGKTLVHSYKMDMYYQQFISTRSSSVSVYGIAATMDINPELPDSVLWVTLWAKDSSTGMYTCIDSATLKQHKREFNYNIIADHEADATPITPVFLSFVVPCYEFYFDQPHRLTDTFYISFRYNTFDIFDAYTYQSGYLGHLGTFNKEVFYGTLPNYWFCNTDGRFENSATQFFTWGFNFPILQPYCQRPETPLVTVDGGEILASWEDYDSQYELSVTRRGMPVDSGFSVPTTDTMLWVTTGLDSGIWYQARLRKACLLYDSLWWSDWSTPTEFYLGNINPDSLGIADIEDSKLKVDITPNPASGMVEVRCSEPMALLELFNAAGDKVFSQQLSTFNFQFSIFNFPSGAYLVRITTPQGVTTRKLVKR